MSMRAALAQDTRPVPTVDSTSRDARITSVSEALTQQHDEPPSIAPLSPTSSAATVEPHGDDGYCALCRRCQMRKRLERRRAQRKGLADPSDRIPGDYIGESGRSQTCIASSSSRPTALTQIPRADQRPIEELLEFIGEDPKSRKSNRRKRPARVRRLPPNAQSDTAMSQESPPTDPSGTTVAQCGKPTSPRPSIDGDSRIELLSACGKSLARDRRSIRFDTNLDRIGKDQFHVTTSTSTLSSPSSRPQSPTRHLPQHHATLHPGDEHSPGSHSPVSDEDIGGEDADNGAVPRRGIVGVNILDHVARTLPHSPHHVLPIQAGGVAIPMRETSLSDAEFMTSDEQELLDAEVEAFRLCLESNSMPPPSFGACICPKKC